jgi:succinate dehydrogenase / fumarate reductase cytochrome b subunit
MFQTVGWSGQIWMKRLKVIGVVVATLVILMFVAAAINGFYQAHWGWGATIA